MGRETITTQFARMEPLILDLIRQVVGDFNNTGGDTLGGPYAIRLYDESVQKVREYSHDSDGLEAALGAADAGDIIWLPAGTIAGNHTVPDGVEVTGCGINTVLSGVITNNGILSKLHLTGTLNNNSFVYGVYDIGAASTIVGGSDNYSEGAYTTVGGYLNQLIGNPTATTCFGTQNEVHSANSMVAGRLHADTGTEGNAIFGYLHTVGGDYNLVHGDEHTVAGSYNAVFGDTQTVPGDYNTVGGFTHDVASGDYNAVFGDSHTVTGSHNAVFGDTIPVTGSNNMAAGLANEIAGSYSVLFGSNSIITGDLNFIGGGDSNTITEDEAAILSCYQGIITGYMGTILGGNGVNISGDYSLGWGNHPTVTHSGAALFADGNYAAPAFPSVANNEFAVRARGGIRLVTDIDGAGATTYAVGMYTGAELRFYEGANYVGFEPPALTGNQIWTLPDADGAASNVLITSGAGVLSWAAASGLPGVATSPGGNDTYVQFNDAGSFGGDAGLVYNKTNDTLTIDGADAVRLILKANAAQTANILSIRNSAGTVLGCIQYYGVPYFDRGHSSNTFMGYLSGVANTVTGVGDEGKYNTFFGYNCGASNTTGNLNSGIGTNCLSSNTSGYQNNAQGYRALAANISGNGNNAIGNSALKSNTTGIRNNAMGANALDSNVSGNYNCGVGYRALRSNVSGSQNVAIGVNAGDSVLGSNNVFIGPYAGYRQTGSNILIIDNQQRADIATEITNAILYGVMAAAPTSQTLRINAVTSIYGGGRIYGNADLIQLLIKAVAGQSANLVELQRSDTTLTAGFDERGVLFSHGGTGATNLFAGDNAGSLTAAGYNVALGENAGQALAAGGTYNTLVGSSAGYELTTGDYNVLIGRQAGMYGQDASGNTFVGYYAGRGTAVYDVYNNTFIGFNAGYSNASGDNNIFIGAYAGWRQTNNSNLLIVDYTQRADVATELSNAILYGVMAAAPANQSLRINALVEVTGNIYPITDDTYYLGKNDDDSPQAWKGLILKDQTTGTYYRLQIDNGAVNLVDLTD